ncbi:MAG TPA: glutathione S-transferase family protein [Gammaproteobacteria bacterium]|jgi:glutathione S-transferase|nr:glutathione S-transferase family protein [Gammaproteobacteria bacterium]HIL61851.1 glutathione S-transferase family protein [Porticoccaceae bacterium]HIN90271.1 glutathione S-transferase family protein [Porticoccaceae bacterium]HIO76534.1 glutathione S-transferase family protein [Gammaproteobacteria bacterium]
MKEFRLVIGNKNSSSWSMCPWLLLKMFDVDFDEIQITLYQDNTVEKLGPYSPSLKVPVLLHRDITVWDSLAICEYISAEILGGSGWPSSRKRRAGARSVSAEMHSEFPALKRDWPMNCKASFRLTPSETLFNEIARIDAMWSCCRHRYGENGNYLYGRFSIADCMFAPIAVCFDAYGAKLSSDSNSYLQTLLDNPFIQKWISLGRREREPLAIAYASTA